MQTYSTPQNAANSLVKSDSASEPADQVGSSKTDIFRYGLTWPLAAVMTTALALTMGSLIATEFTPQDKAETRSFEINPEVVDIDPPIREVTLDPLKEVEVPPAMPVIESVQTAAVNLPIVEVTGRRTDFEMQDIDFGTLFDTVPIDQDLTPLVRVPPIFPNRFLQGDVSGYCRVQFDISLEGKPINVAATICTDKRLKSPTIKSVQDWKYAPQMRNGRPVIRSGLKTTIRFDLQDERGNLLPVPSGF